MWCVWFFMGMVSRGWREWLMFGVCGFFGWLNLVLYCFELCWDWVFWFGLVFFVSVFGGVWTLEWNVLGGFGCC